ncbi:hypothetical protein EZV62_012142 [Acer yangbiense]|uniref:Calcineurin-like phosphoesterase domain-containing protein n=1 Tax=Acer yangbiense TaxID=1000413 RepID=A0A5C7HVL5_9ROSI|nr:hypothetical protein EZV62_012142 [Acer yangbiense]
MERKPTWVCTLVTQLCLCLALYGALNLGQPQKSIYQKSDDFYFISVGGGFRPFKQQTHLLKLFLLLMKMERVANSYQARFVVNTSELGENDPLKQNATMIFRSLKVPWYTILCNQLPDVDTFVLHNIRCCCGHHKYTTRASKGQEFGCFQEKIKLPHSETLDIIGVDTGSLQETMLAGLSSGSANNQINWLTRTLERTDSNWCIVVGFHPLVVCEENKEQMKAKRIYNSLHHIFMKFGVNLYLSKQGCTRYSCQDSVTYIENPDLIKFANGRETVDDGFLLHRVSSLEIATYFVTLYGEVMHRTVIRQRGKEVM